MHYITERSGGLMKYGIAGMILFLIIFVLTGCGAAASQQTEVPESFLVLEWNVQALHDGLDNGNEYGEYLESAGWTSEKYMARITAISQALIQSFQPAGSSKAEVPGLIGFVEIENAGVLEDLARGALSKYGYYWTAFAILPGSSLGIGFLSRFPLKDVRTHSITIEDNTAPRPVLEVKVEPGGKPLIFLLCHWKSKLGGDSATESLRRASARVVQRRLREIRETEAEIPVIVMGDLNENHDEFSRRLILSALLPDNPDAAAMAAGAPDDFLVLSGEKPPRPDSFPEDVPILYSPWYDEMNNGSYYYRDGWETIDHFLLSDRLFDGLGWDYAGYQVLNQAPFATKEGTPNSYNPRNGFGLSDHLPLLLFLQFIQ